MTESQSWNIVSRSDYGNGFYIEKLEGERGDIYYRACNGDICRYCEDEYIAELYLRRAGWDGQNN